MFRTSIKFQFITCIIVLLFIALSPTINAQVSLMPMPTKITTQPGDLQLSTQFNVSVSGFSESRKAFQLARLAKHLSRIANEDVRLVEKPKGSEVALSIAVANKESSLLTPQFNEDESYSLAITKNGIEITANTVFGAQHGLSTLLQLARFDNKHLLFQKVAIDDAPRFPWRGLLIDSVRHFISLDTIKRQLDGMASAKLNVLHWHLTDDQGWRMESKRFPKLTEKASDGLFYSQEEIKEVIEYASKLGIRIVPEFGMPGHASAIAVASPELMSKQKDYEMERHWGVFKPLLDVSNPAVYQFVDALIGEMVTIFPDQYLHIGGDEVEPEHWLHNKQIQALMQTEKLENGADIQNYFNTQVLPIIQKHQRIMMGWDEIFHPELPKDIIVQSWRGHDSLNAVANSGYRGILSTGFYIDQPQYTDYHYRNDPLRVFPEVDVSEPQVFAKAFVIDRLKGSDVKGELVVLGDQVLIKLNKNNHQLAQVNKVVKADTKQFVAKLDSWMGPLTFEFNFIAQQNFVMIGNSRYPVSVSTLSSPQAVSLSETLSSDKKNLILGAEATIWTEMVTDENIDLRIWPRLYAISERLWSNKGLTNSADMYQRLAKVDQFAAEVIGLEHRTQQQAGWQGLIDESEDLAKQKSSLALLETLAELVEPAHYYTRHHIKYLNDEYHQRAPLDLYVDYLAVESSQIRALHEQVAAFKNGDKEAFSTIKRKLDEWHSALSNKQLAITKQHETQLHELLAKVTEFVELAKQVTSYCEGTQLKTDVLNSLMNLQSLSDEIVLAGITPMRELYMACE